MLFDPVLLKTFVAVCDAKSFTDAARRVHLTQPAVSLHVRRLEEQAGKRLIDRTAAPLALTADGDVLLSYARRILALHEEAKISLGQSQPRGLVRFGAPEYFAPTVLASLLAQFANLNPDVVLEVEVGLGPDIAALFDRGRLDVAIVNRELGETDGVVLSRERRVFAAARCFELDPAKPVPLALYPPHCAWRRLAVDSLDAAGRSWTIVLQSAGAAGLAAAVEAGLGVSVFGEAALTRTLRPLGAGEGFPALPDFAYPLRRGGGASLAVARLSEAIVDFFQLSAALRRPARVRPGENSAAQDLHG